MPSHTSDITLTDPTLVIVPWYDDVVDAIGYDPRSAYCELYWLNVLGPHRCEVAFIDTTKVADRSQRMRFHH